MESQVGVVSENQTEADLQELLQQLLQCIGDNGKSSPALRVNGKSEEVVFELRLDGAHYTLIRTYSQNQPEQPQVSLSPREQEIVRLVTKGHPNKAIAAVLDISRWTVATHLRRVYSKLGVNCRAEMVARVLRDGLLGGRE